MNVVNETSVKLCNGKVRYLLPQGYKSETFSTNEAEWSPNLLDNIHFTIVFVNWNID